ncbi:glutathione S-transferase family protein [Pseudidiomarina sp. 1APP75-32.1]|uniref:Glutathione S-transferase family protein n=1 Tax=Pseudidiomarina terrestris TaxID=2820060 RepID=A0AAW7QYY9_9GAMM|nr:MULTISPECIES: glutathione S-transferase family protein [unclassified Pseudidiomarina]MDN7123565.1 glutathione S-transferase family protein [Pseudidiomarina sp. 1APP75-32.1]MDN7128711.1 glutathione S-transferase family protein [Pseudidiomarina sp. 1APR75-15]
MGLLVDGKWQDKWYDTEENDGRFERSESQFRNWLSADPDAEFPAESGRYHLYVCYACPWAHRTLIFRKLKGLEEHVSMSAVHPLMLENGWEFGDDILADPLYQQDYLYQLYLRADDNYSGRVTVPVLWDKKKQTIVSNESADIIRMFNSAFDSITGNTLDFYPQALRNNIDSINDKVYDTINNGVYKCGFATRQKAYNDAYDELFASLDDIEERLSSQRFLVGDQVTEADWRLFTTLVRFDAVYYSHFKTNQQRILDYPAIWDYVKALYQVPGVAETVVMDHIKTHYYASHTMINPTQIVPRGPRLDFNAPHGRGEVL